MPTRSARISSSEVVSVSTAIQPRALALSIQRWSWAASRTHSYFVVSMFGRGGRPALAMVRGDAGMSSGITGTATFIFSATRRVIVRNSIAIRKARRVSGSGSFTSSSSSVTSNGMSQSSWTSLRERRIWSAWSMSVWRRLGWEISSARARRESRSPNSWMRRAAVLIPMPGAPGTLSTESPASAWTSTTRSGGTPK